MIRLPGDACYAAAFSLLAAAMPGAANKVQSFAVVMHARQTLPLTCGPVFQFSPLVIGLLAGASVLIGGLWKDEPSVGIPA